MTHEEFFDALKRGEIAPAYFFHGEEEHVKASALEALRARLLPAGLEALNETALQNPAAAVVVAAAETLPLMAERRLVVVRDSALLTAGKASDEAAESAALVDYLGRLPDTAWRRLFLPRRGRRAEKADAGAAEAGGGRAL